MSTYTSVASMGGLLPTDLLERVRAGDRGLEGTSVESYGLVPGERLSDQITRSWNRLRGVWEHFSNQLDALTESDRTATGLTRDRWLRPLLDELGFAGLHAAGGLSVEGKDYPISHEWGSQVPVHLMGARVPIDRRSAGVAGAATASPHGLMQELLNRSHDHLWGIVSNGLLLRVLRDNASLTRQAYVEFDLRAMFDGDLFSDFVVLWLTCHRTRFEGSSPEKCLLERWSAEVAQSGTRALDKLRDGVEAAIAALGEGFVAHPANLRLRATLHDGTLSTSELQHQVLRVVYRLLFLLVAESRDLLRGPGTDEVAVDRYRRYYSLHRLRSLAEERRGTSHDDLWQGLQVTMGALHRDGAAELGLAPLGSLLWSPDATAALGDARLDNRHLLDAIRSLCFVHDDDSRVHRAVDYHNLGAEELGSIYESLLELHAVVDPDARTFHLDTAAGNERKTTGSYYTPTPLIRELLDSALDPVLDEAVAAPDPEAALLDLKVLDPAVGSGHFLIAAANRIASRLASVRVGGGEPAPDELRHALRDVVSRCLYGIDANPMAVELCKVSLWMEETEPGRPLSFLDHRIVCGNSLLGATPALIEAGVPDGAFKALEGDDREWVTKLKRRNKAEREKTRGQGMLALDGSVGADVAVLAKELASIDQLGDDNVGAVVAKAERFAELVDSPTARRARFAADAWCTAFVAHKCEGAAVVTDEAVRLAGFDPGHVPADVRQAVQRYAEEYRFLHLHLAFPDVFAVPADLSRADNELCGWSGGFDVVLGNPPWDKVEFKEQEWFAVRDPEVAELPGDRRKRAIKALETSDPELHTAYLTARRQNECERHLLANTGRYPLCGKGKINTSSVFAELMHNSISPTGRVGAVVPTAIATDDTTKDFFADLVERASLVQLHDFENRRPWFPNVHRSYKFCLLTVSGPDRPVDEAEFVFFAIEVADLEDHEKRFTLTPSDFELLNPNTKTCPVFRTRRDAEITKAIYRRVPVLVRENDPDGNPWGVTFKQGLFNMTSDSHLFRTREQLESDGWTLEGNHFVRGDDRYLPLYEAKMVHHFDHRWATYEGTATRDVTLAEKQDPRFVVVPRYWVREQNVWELLPGGAALTGWRKTARSTDSRTVIAAHVPLAGAGDKLQLLIDPAPPETVLLLAAFNSFVHDAAVRQKHNGTDLSLFLVRQFPVPQCGSLERERRLLTSLVLELSYTSWDLCAFAADLGYDRPPFKWDVDRRAVLRAELDALMFRLYGIERDDVDYILDTFPIVKRKDEAAFGEYRTKRLILERYDAMAEAEAEADGREYESMLDPPPADPSLAHDPSTRPEWADWYLKGGE